MWREWKPLISTEEEQQSEGARMTYCDGILQVHNEEDYWKTTERVGLLHSGGGEQGALMDEGWGMSSRSEYAPSEMGSSAEDTISMVDESCEAVGGLSSEGDDAEEVHANSAEGSGKGGSRKRRREPIVEGRRWRQKAAGYGFMFDKEGRGLRGVVSVSVRGRCTLEKICKFNKMLEPYQKEAIEGTILKPILEYRPFSMQWELTATLVKAWAPRRKAFRLAGRLVPFSVYDVALFTGLPVTGKIVEFGKDDLSTTELAKMVRPRMAQYVTEKSDNLKSEKGRKRPVLELHKGDEEAIGRKKRAGEGRVVAKSICLEGDEWGYVPKNPLRSRMKYMEDVRGMGEYAWAEAVWRVLVEAIEEMQRKLEGPVFDVQMYLWFYEHTTRFAKHDKCRFPRLTSWDSVDHGGRYDALPLVEGIKESEVIPVLRPWEEEMLVPTVRAFMKTDGFRDYILDGEGVLSYEERLEQAREELRAEKGKPVDTLRMLEFWKSHVHELEARLKRCAAPAAQQDTRHQAGGDVGVDVHSGVDSMAGAVTDMGEATVYEISPSKGAQEDATCKTTAEIPGGTCDDQSMQERMVEANAPVDACDDAGDGPQCSEPHGQPCAAVEHAGERGDDATAMPCGEDDVSAQVPAPKQQ
ncbi:hypothetical protein Cgig2_003883 [Carnegiea gigantea]|uniref:Uncharacterized protein n=1 Tax=Carnegiea gigantea TaxID=171969 RepID=A0A9Q1Q7B5_9CARY|nr:hypothetical protein Cgig2_003883 [Carnegiea gigantea]